MIRYCGRCGKLFDTHSGQKVYCSKRCRVLYTRWFNAGKRLEEIIDKIIDKTLELGKTPNFTREELYGYRYNDLLAWYRKMNKDGE